MMKYMIIAHLLLAHVVTLGQQKQADMDNELDSVSYALGVNVAKNLQDQGIQVSPEAFADGLREYYANNPQMLPQEAQQFVQQYVQQKQMKESEKYLKEGEKFLAENAKREEVKVTESGLQYEVIEMGDGPKPAATDQVKVHYHGTLIDGTVFDSSVDRGQPITFALNRVIKGWTEGLQLMPVGSTFKLYIPQELAYGAKPRPGGPIKPYMALVFEVELIDIVEE